MQSCEKKNSYPSKCWYIFNKFSFSLWHFHVQIKLVFCESCWIRCLFGFFLAVRTMANSLVAADSYHSIHIINGQLPVGYITIPPSRNHVYLTNLNHLFLYLHIYIILRQFLVSEKRSNTILSEINKISTKLLIY